MKHLFLAFVALVIPAFFAAIYLMSSYNRLGTLRQRCREAAAQLQSARDEVDREAAQTKWKAAAESYTAARGAFPGRIFSALFRFEPPDPPPATQTRDGTASASARNNTA